jgi:ribosome-associated heat shock protein Hsp15
VSRPVPSQDSAPGACRADVWLWRARLFKTRSLAQGAIEQGRVRLTRAGRESRLDKPSRGLQPGDLLVFALAGRVTAVRVAALGVRRGPPVEARGLYDTIESDAGTTESDSRAGDARDGDALAGDDGAG